MDKKLVFKPEIYLKIMKLLQVIDSFKGNWEAKELKESKHLKELKKIATIASIGSSTRIEGAELSNEEIEKLLQNLKITNLTTRDEQEVIGYYEALEIILDNYNNLELTERYVHQLHGILLKHSTKDQRHRGKYKTTSNRVVANYPGGEQKVIFNTTEPALTPKEMESLFAWIKERYKKEDIHPVIVVGAFVYEFLSIHPYKDGNGRLSRLLTTLFLIKQGYGFIQYVSLENIIEERKKEYYKVLMDGQKNRYKENEIIDAWMLFFLDCLVTLINRLKAKYETYSKLERELNDRQQALLKFINEQKKVQMKEVEIAFSNESRNTLKKDLAYLVKEGMILKTGERKGTRYHFKE